MYWNGFGDPPSLTYRADFNDIEYNREAYIATGMGANKTKRLLRDKRASVCYRADGNNITLVGEAEIFTDQETKTATGWTGSLTISPATKPIRIIVSSNLPRNACLCG